MQGLPILAAIVLAASVAGCATRIDVDAHEDLAPYHTWAWLPRALPKVQAPHRDAGALEADLARLIDRELAARGYDHVDGEAEFYVAYQLALRRETVWIDQPRASYELSTHTSDGAYRVEGTEKVPRTYEQLDLAVGVTDARGQTLWHARLTTQEEDPIQLDIEAAVANLLDRFPHHQPGASGH